jgi:hypothetical protein
MNTIKVDSVEEAVERANQLRRSGRTWWFRGQVKDWPLRSSFVRMKPEERQLALERLARYEAWFKQTPGLENLAANVDSAIAVAQHYGMPTNFVDFTTEPEIAGFFASEKVNSDTAKDMACIICLDVEDLKEFWQPLAKRILPPEFLEMEVPDLWRLEAQHGRFLFCPYENIEHLYDFDRILYPNTHPVQGLRREDVYPDRKSHLEALLDQFFMTEQMLAFERDSKLDNWAIHVIEAPADKCDPDVFPKGLPQHSSWSEATVRPWLELYAEDFYKVRTSVSFRIQVAYPRNLTEIAIEVAKQLLPDLFDLPRIRSKLVAWDLQIMGDHDLPQDFSSRIAPRLARLWDGLRRLPHSNEDLSVGLGLCLALGIALGGDFETGDSWHWERAVEQCLAEPVELEFGAEDGSYSKGYAAAASLRTAIRTDILSHVSDDWKDQLSRNVRGMLQTSWNPKKTFDFPLLTPLFAREIAPYKVLARDAAIFYSPARLMSLGLP